MGKVIVDAGAWQLAMNALRRDADAGMHVRAEIVEELEKATISLTDEWQLVPKEPTDEMRSAATADSCWENMNPPPATAYRSMLAAAPLPPNAGGKPTGPDGPSA